MGNTWILKLPNWVPGFFFLSGGDNADFQPAGGCSAVQFCFHLPCWFFFPISPAPWLHVYSTKYDSNEDSIQSVRLMFIYLHSQASSLFPTSCTEHLVGGGKVSAIPVTTFIIVEHSSLANLVWFMHCRHNGRKFKLYHTAELPGSILRSYRQSEFANFQMELHSFFYTGNYGIEKGKKITSSKLPQETLHCVPTNYLCKTHLLMYCFFTFHPT